jgi:hypothetical protein
MWSFDYMQGELDSADFESIRRCTKIGVLFGRPIPRGRMHVQRPTGVTVIAILYWLSAFVLIMLGSMMAIGFTAFGGMMSGMSSLLAGFGVIGGIVLLGFGAVMAVIGYSLFQLQEWARVTTIVLVALGFLMGVLGLLHPIGVGRFSSLVRMGIDAFIIWYLVQPQVSGAFRRA